MAKKSSKSTYDQQRYKALYEEDEVIGGDQLLDNTQYGLDDDKIVNPTRYFLNYQLQIETILWLADLKDKKVLDIACGDGIIAARSNNIYQNYTGIDISLKRLDRCKSLYGNDKTVFQYVDVVEGLPFPDSSMDVVIASEIIEHVVDVTNFLLEIQRVLAPGGTLVISTPNSYHHQDLSHNLYEEQHLRLYSRDQLIKDVEQFGFKVDQKRGTGLNIPHKIIKGHGFELLDNPRLNKLYFSWPRSLWLALFNGLNILGWLLGAKYRNQTIIRAIKQV